MKLNEQGLRNRAAWEARGYRLPAFDRRDVAAATAKAPVWVHFGNGNLFKAFQARAVQRLLDEGAMDRGVITADRRPHGDDPNDGYTLAVTLKADGTVEKTVVGSVTERVYLAGGMARLGEIFRCPSLQMCSFTITEKGYSLTDGRGQLPPDAAADMERGPAEAQSYFGKVTALLYKRYLAGGVPLAMVSMDNCSHNGDKLRSVLDAFAARWTANGSVEPGFAQWLAEKVSCPWSMIDKITPAPDAAVGAMLAADGVEEPFSFVNAEETEYLVIEDSFPNGRPPLERAGVIFTDRQTVDKAEKMKVCTCLNPLHTCLAVYGCLLGYTKISDEMADPDLTAFIRNMGYGEGLPVAADPGILDPGQFIDTVINVRFPNPFMPDTPQRIATDTSQKLPVRFGETVKAYIADPARDVKSLRLIPLVFAGWLRYLMGVDDSGKAFEPSPDPLLDTLRPHVAGLKLTPGQDVESAVEPILHRADIFGADLYEAGLAERVCGYLAALTAGPGAVRATLQKTVHSREADTE